MPYLGNSPASNFASVTKDTFSGDGSTTAFTLSKAATTNGVAVFVENVRQEPTTAYAVSGTTLTFTAAPVSASGNNIYVLHHNAPASTATHPSAQALTATSGTFTGTVTAGSTLDMNGTEVILDADADTSITADTDDVIDFKIGGTDRIQFTAAGGITTTPSAGGNITINEGGVDADLRIESANDVYALFMNGEKGHFGIGSNNSDYMGSNNTGGVLSLTVPTGGYAVFELAAEGADSADALAGTIAFHNTLQTGGSQLINIRGTTEGSTSADRGGRFTVGTKENGGSSPTERIRVTSNGYFKGKGNMSSYIGASDTMHEFSNSEGSMPVLQMLSGNSSYADNSFAVGCFRASSNAYSLISAFHGNGSSAGFSDRVFTVTGQGEIASDHSTSITSGADYAEYFEWKDGNSSSEDRIGQSVVLDGNKIRKATSDDSASNILGVISGNPSVVGDSAELRWQGKWELDDFNRRQTEEVEIWEWTDPEGTVDEIGNKHPKFHSYQKDKVPEGVTVPSDKTVKKVINDKYSSSYDESKKDDYVPRSQRKEWDAVGLMGKLRMLKGQPTGDRWIKMRDISDTVEEWLVR